MPRQSSTEPLRPRSILLDTNVWINSQLGAHEGYREAREVLVQARKRGIRIGIAFHSLTDVFYVITQELKRANSIAFESGRNAIQPERITATAKETAWGVLESIMGYAEVVGGDGSDARIATLYKSLHDDFEDDLIFAAAHRMGADLIVSDDSALVRRSPLPALSTKDALRWIEASGSSKFKQSINGST